MSPVAQNVPMRPYQPFKTSSAEPESPGSWGSCLPLDTRWQKPHHRHPQYQPGRI